MHRKLRLYQSKLELSEIHSMKVEEKLKEINKILQILGITLDDLKASCQTGKINIFKGDSINTRNFEISSSVAPYNRGISSVKSLKGNSKKKVSDGAVSKRTKNNQRITYKKKGSSLSMRSQFGNEKLMNLNTDEIFSDSSNENSIATNNKTFYKQNTLQVDYNINIEPPKSAIDDAAISDLEDSKF